MQTALLALAVAALLYAISRGSGVIPGAPTEPSGLPGGHQEWDNQIRYASNLVGLPTDEGPLILKAIIEHESAHTWNPEVVGDYTPSQCAEEYPPHPVGFRPGVGAVSTAGYCALGLMQIHRYWHPVEASVYDLLDGAQNILAGSYIVGALYRSFGEWDRVLAAYNGGAGAGNAWPNVTAQVRSYVANVGGTFRRYAQDAGFASA